MNENNKIIMPFQNKVNIPGQEEEKINNLVGTVLTSPEIQGMLNILMNNIMDKKDFTLVVMTKQDLNSLPQKETMLFKVDDETGYLVDTLTTDPQFQHNYEKMLSEASDLFKSVYNQGETDDSQC